MNTFTSKLDQFEAKLQAFIEGRLSRLSPLRGGYENLSRQLVASMRAGTISTGDGVLLAPDQFTLLVHPEKANKLKDEEELLEALADLIQTKGVIAGMYFGQHPEVNVSANEDVSSDKVDIIARISEKALGQTAALNSAVPDKENTIPTNAFLIVNGRDIFQLDQTVINIGRRSSNQLKIDDPRVSRQHAQIRVMNGRFEIFDLNSTGGTYINQQPITQCLLRPGDVISLAGVHLIYGQDRSSSLKDTKELGEDDDTGKRIE